MPQSRLDLWSRNMSGTIENPQETALLKRLARAKKKKKSQLLMKIHLSFLIRMSVSRSLQQLLWGESIYSLIKAARGKYFNLCYFVLCVNCMLGVNDLLFTY